METKTSWKVTARLTLLRAAKVLVAALGAFAIDEAGQYMGWFAAQAGIFYPLAMAAIMAVGKLLRTKYPEWFKWLVV